MLELQAQGVTVPSFDVGPEDEQRQKGGLSWDRRAVRDCLRLR